MHARWREAFVRLNAPRKNDVGLPGRLDHKAGMHFCRLEVSGFVKNLRPELVPVATALLRRNFYYPATVVLWRCDARRARPYRRSRAAVE
jgi:hypothetical protein